MSDFSIFDFIYKVACENESVECEKEELFKRITDEMFSIYRMKNRNYGNSFSKSFKEFGMVMPCIRLSDKIERLKSLVKQGEDADCDDESIVDTLIDTSIYAIMTVMELEDRK